jgi:hypothetical protein
VTDLLDRVFGPDPDGTGFPPFNEGKVIPVHECEWLEQRAWGCVWVSCPVCQSQVPEPLIRGAVDAANDG